MAAVLLDQFEEITGITQGRFLPFANGLVDDLADLAADVGMLQGLALSGLTPFEARFSLLDQGGRSFTVIVSRRSDGAENFLVVVCQKSAGQNPKWNRRFASGPEPSRSAEL